MRQQKQSKEVACEICGKKVRARGYKPHIRLAHKLILTTQVSQAVTKVDSSQPFSSDLSEIKQVERKKVAISSSDTEKKVNSIPAWTMPVYYEGSVSFGERVMYYRANPEMARKQWESMVEIQKRTGWVESYFSEPWQALKRALNIQGSGY